MKKKIIIIAICAIALIAAGLIFLFTRKEKKSEPNIEKITITFNVDGGEEIKPIKVEKDKEISLPTPVKESYNFQGWFINGEKVKEKISFSKDTTLTAKWQAIPKDSKTMKVVFDSQGGSNVKSLTIECGKALSFPATPTKKGYNFLGWTDKDGNVIESGKVLTCKDLTLLAKWEAEKK